MKKKVLIFGVFDHLHPGHLSFIDQAAKHGQVVAIVARDENVRRLKKKQPDYNERSRLQSVARLKNVFRARLGGRHLDNPYRVIKEEGPEVICLGYDQRFFVRDLPKVLKDYHLNTKIIRLKPHKPHIYKSSKMKKNR